MNAPLGRPIRVVFFGGRYLQPVEAQFAAVLDEHPEIDLVLGVCQGEGFGPGQRLRDLWRRRGWLAPALLAANALNACGRFLLHPRATLSWQHRTARALPPSARPDAVGVLTGLGGQLGVDDLRSAGRHLRHVIDPDGSARHAEEDFNRRWLSLAPMLDGMHSIDGVLDAETASGLATPQRSPTRSVRRWRPARVSAWSSTARTGWGRATTRLSLAWRPAR